MSTLREVQLKGYEILNQVVDICEENNLTYYLSSGTLLGAIRHDGFIPWDNDIDIEMPLKDYRKFLQIAKKELPENLFLQTYYTDPGYNEMWAKVRANGTTSIQIAWKDYGIHLGIGIDVFPLVGIYKNPFLRKLQVKLHGLCRTLIAKDYVVAVNPTELQNKKLRMLYTIPRSIRVGICKLLEHFTFRDPSKEENVSIVFMEINYAVKGNAYDSSVKKKFESREFLIPQDYDHVLTQLYGDYMTPPPESERNGHEGTHGRIIYDCDRDYYEYLRELREVSSNCDNREK